jgi:hypothetical protein
MLSIPFNRKQFGNFSNYNISTDGGLLLLDKIESKFSIVKDAAKLVKDIRNTVFITHTMESMMKQLVYGICMGYSDLNDQSSFSLFTHIKGVKSDNKFGVKSHYRRRSRIFSDLLGVITIPSQS